MICPICHIEMHRVGMARIVDGKILAEFECPQCHQRMPKTVLPQRPFH